MFGEAIAETPEAVQATWQAIKAREKGEVAETLTHCLSRYAATLPPLTAALKISQRAAKAGFEWPNLAGVWDKFEEELAELKEALDSGDRDHAEAELGDLLFSLVNIARWCQLDPVAALQGTNDRFVARFQKVEAAAGQSLDSLGIETLEKLWQQAKRELGQSSV